MKEEINSIIIIRICIYLFIYLVSACAEFSLSELHYHSKVQYVFLGDALN